MAELHVDKLSVNRIKHADDSDYLTAADTNSKFQPGNSVSGSALYDTSGTFTFVVPTGVIKLSALCIGAGGGGFGGGGVGTAGAGAGQGGKFGRARGKAVDRATPGRGSRGSGNGGGGGGAGGFDGGGREEEGPRGVGGGHGGEGGGDDGCRRSLSS